LRTAAALNVFGDLRRRVPAAFRLPRGIPMEHDDLRSRIREKLLLGHLPSIFPPTGVTTRMWIGPGSGQPCAGCGEIISPAQLESEFDLSSGLTVRLHDRCQRIWDEEAGRGRRG
jgi:hypothetical protein